MMFFGTTKNKNDIEILHKHRLCGKEGLYLHHNLNIISGLLGYGLSLD